MHKKLLALYGLKYNPFTPDVRKRPINRRSSPIKPVCYFLKKEYLSD